MGLSNERLEKIIVNIGGKSYSMFSDDEYLKIKQIMLECAHV